jgi:hypothetical protein
MAAGQALADEAGKGGGRWRGLGFFPKRSSKAQAQWQPPKNVWFRRGVLFWNKSQNGTLALTRRAPGEAPSGADSRSHTIRR